MTSREFAEVTGVSRETVARLEHYAHLLERWSRAINLVSRETLGDVWRRHFLDSAQLVRHLPLEREGRQRVILDIGAGAGFPGLVLSVLGAGQVHLVESDLRKCTFLQEAIRETGSDARVHARRVESLGVLPVDVVTARAVAPLARLIGLCEPFLRQRHGEATPVGIFLKGRNLELELTESHKMWIMEVETFPSITDDSARIVRLRLEREKDPSP